jgi:hypothetical protein
MSIMRMAAVGLLLGPGCAYPQEPNTPGEPELYVFDFPDSRFWVQGESNDVIAAWSNTCAGTGDWLCPYSSMTVEDIHCAGCLVTHDPIEVLSSDRVVFGGIATTDGAITVGAQLRFDQTGATRMVSLTATGDHEVALEATCKLIDSAALQRYLAFTVPTELFRDCDTPRGTGDVAVVFPVLRTFQGKARFPFCADSSECTRPRSSLSISLAPTGWGHSDRLPGQFAILPDVAVDTDVALSAPLMPTGLGTAMVTIPAASP